MTEEPIDPYGGQPYQPYGPAYPPYQPYQPYAPYSPYEPYPAYPSYAPQTAQRPGTVVAAAVLSFVDAGLLAIASLVLLAGAASSRHDFLLVSNSLATELTVDAVVNLAAATMFTLGAVLLLGGKALGQPLIAIAAVIVGGAMVYWTIRAEGVFTGMLVFGALFAALAVIGVSLAHAPTARAWLLRPVVR